MDAAWGAPAVVELRAVGEPSRSSVRHLAEPFVLGALRRGRCVEQFLGPVGTPERPGIRYVEVRPVGGAFEIVLHTRRDVGHQGFVDVGEFPALDADDDEEEFGRLVATASDPLTALATAEHRTGAIRARWVNAGVVQDEYSDFVRAGRPSDASPDGHPWPVPGADC